MYPPVSCTTLHECISHTRAGILVVFCTKMCKIHTLVHISPFLLHFARAKSTTLMQKTPPLVQMTSCFCAKPKLTGGYRWTPCVRFVSGRACFGKGAEEVLAIFQMMWSFGLPPLWTSHLATTRRVALASPGCNFFNPHGLHQSSQIGFAWYLHYGLLCSWRCNF